MERNRYDGAMLRERLGGLPLHIFREIDSTNSEARRYAWGGGAIPAVFLAEGQTAGRGRMGRGFYSPDGTGIYFSLLFELPQEPNEVTRLTALAAVGVLRAIRRVTGVTPAIKWVNDLYLEGKKIAGILAESFLAEKTRCAVLGVGVNLCTADFPAELKNVAGSLMTHGGLRNELTAALIEEVWALLKSPDAAVMAEYRAHSTVLGKTVTYTQNGIRYEGVAQAIDDGGRLTVRRADGVTVLLSGGEISLRLANQEKKEDL
ncbi:MAG: biotin--[Clostridia bacterium]|nr:biotin--[acetyl-CoA-carboxylase] ligase [Clostridia bacterium]